MDEVADNRRQEHGRRMDRPSAAVPWLKRIEGDHYTAKVFRSGNSLALRLPAGLGLEAGMTMDLRAEEGRFSFAPADAPKRKFAIDKVWGSATDLAVNEDRRFAERSEEPSADRT